MQHYPSPTFTIAQYEELDLILKTQSGYVANRARFLLALSNPHGLARKAICQAHGYSPNTATRLMRDFSQKGLAALSYGFNVESGLKRRKLSHEAVERAVEIALAHPANAKTIMSALIKEGFHPTDIPLSADTLIAALKREGLTWQRTRYGLKKNATPSHTKTRGLK
jgi:transposase